MPVLPQVSSDLATPHLYQPDLRIILAGHVAGPRDAGSSTGAVREERAVKAALTALKVVTPATTGEVDQPGQRSKNREAKPTEAPVVTRRPLPIERRRCAVVANCQGVHIHQAFSYQLTGRSDIIATPAVGDVSQAGHP